MCKIPRQVQNFSSLGSSGKRRIVSFEEFAQLFSSLTRYQTVKFIFEFFCSKLTDLLRELLAVFVESKEFVFIFIMIELQATHHPDLRQDVFVKDEYRFLNVPGIGTITVYDTFDCTFECLSNPSCMFVSEPGRLQKSRWNTLVRIADFE